MVGIKLCRRQRRETLENRICYAHAERPHRAESKHCQPSRDTWTHSHTEHNYTRTTTHANRPPSRPFCRGCCHMCVTLAASGKRCGIEFRQILSSHRMQHCSITQHNVRTTVCPGMLRNDSVAVAAESCWAQAEKCQTQSLIKTLHAQNAKNTVCSTSRREIMTTYLCSV